MKQVAVSDGEKHKNLSRPRGILILGKECPVARINITFSRAQSQTCNEVVHKSLHSMRGSI